MKKLTDKIALVTSASRGIGLACALKLAEHGATVYMGVRRMEDTQKICDDYRNKGYQMIPVFFNAAQKETYDQMVQDICEKEHRIVIPHMMENGGSIINISSIGGMIPDVTRIGYGVSKAAINNITQQIAIQYARNHIRCNAVLPGLTATDAALKNMPETFIQSFLSHVPLNRMGKPEDIANAVLFFASEDSSYITGHILDVAGGYGLGTPQYADTIRSTL